MDLDLLDPSVLNEDDILADFATRYAEAPTNAKKSEVIDWLIRQIAPGDVVLRDMIIDTVAKQYKITKKTLNAKLEAIQRETASRTPDTGIPEIELPEDVDAEVAYRDGFFESKRAYYFISKDAVPFKASNFVIRPLYHIDGTTNNKRLIEIENEFYEKKIVDMESRVTISADLFQQAVYSRGNYIFRGSGMHHKRIIEKISRNFKTAYELNTLGWQREGFYAFANGILADGSWQAVNNFGITQHKESMYFSPAFSEIYISSREGEDDYENDRFFVYNPPLTGFAQWAKLFCEVYGENGRMGVAFLIASLFRDYIYDTYKVFPHLFLFGEKQSGKSQLAWSLSNVFYNNMPAFNLNSGTQVGFFRRLSRVKNALCWYDEYTNDIDEKRFQALKSAYDGMGHEKGKMTRDARTEITKINSASVLSGQYLPTRDDNALFTRSIVLNFEKRNYNADEMEKYNELKALEKQGISGLLAELVPLREAIETAYIETFAKIYDKLKNDLSARNHSYDERIIRNYSTMLAPVKILGQKLTFPFTYDQFYMQCLDSIAAQSMQIQNSEAVSSFWRLIEFMLEKNWIEHGTDFKISTLQKHTLNLKTKRDVWERVQISEPTKLLFIRFTKIHGLYLEAHRKQYGRNGIDDVSLMHYIKHHRAYLGMISSTEFAITNTSAYVFDYQKLGVLLERTTSTAENPQNQPESTGIQTDKPDFATPADLPF